MEKNVLLTIIHASEDIDIIAEKIKKEKTVDKCKSHLAKCIDTAFSIENFLLNTSALIECKHIINDIIEDFRIAQNSKSIDEIHSKMRSCIYSNSIIYANLIELYKKYY